MIILKKTNEKNEYQFEVTLNKDDYCSYLLYQSSLSKAGRRVLISIQLTFPLLALLVIVYFKYNWLILIALVAASIFWIFILSPYFWRKLNEAKINKINNESYPVSFQKFSVIFEQEYFVLNNIRYNYSDVQRILVFASLIIFTLVGTNEFILPTRCLKDNSTVEFVDLITQRIKKGDS